MGIISSKKRLVTEENLRENDRIILLKSNGINANGVSLARAIGKKLKAGYATKLNKKISYGEALLTKTNIYAQLIQNLLNEKINIHYIANITGHGLRKIMRARANYSYVLETIYEPSELFLFIQKHARLSDYEMYQTLNMGMDYALFIPQKDVKKCLAVIKKNRFHAIDAGVVEKGKKQLIIKPKNLTYSGTTLNLR